MERDEKDYGTAELHRQQKVVLNNGLARVYAQLPIDYLKEKSVITDGQWQAGDRLNYLFIASQLFRHRSSNISEERGTSLSPLNELSGAERAEIEYKQTVKELHAAIRTLTVNVCCYHKQPQYKEITQFKDGLNQLQIIFKIK